MKTKNVIFCKRFTICFISLLSIQVIACASIPVCDETNRTMKSPIIYVSISDSKTEFSETAQRVVPENLQGMKVSFNSNEMTDNDLKLDLRLNYRNVTEMDVERIWRTTTLFLLTLYPSTCGHRAYELTATLSDKQGHSRTYEESDSTVAWLWLLQGSKCGVEPTKEEITSASERMLSKILARMRKENIFARIGSEITVHASPLIDITLNQASDIARQLLTTERHFPRWMIGGAATPDYRIDLHFDTGATKFSLPKAYLAIMTACLSGSPCTSTPLKLEAVITGRDGTTIRSYSFSDSMPGRMGSGNHCESQNESTRPDVYRKLLHKAFQQMVHDKIFEPGNSPPKAATPLIQINASRAEGIVRHETRLAMPFQRYYFVNTTEYVPDYSLNLDFKFEGGGRKELTFPSAAITAFLLGLTGWNNFCKPTIMTLDAVLCDHSGKEIRHYHITKTVNYSGDLTIERNCRDDEVSNSNAVRKLVKELYAEMEADGTLAMFSSSIDPPK